MLTGTPFFYFLIRQGRVVLPVRLDETLFFSCLLGDKVETAQTIAVSSRLVSRNQSMYVMTKVPNSNAAREELSCLSGENDHCLIIDGVSLQHFLDEFPKEFAEVAMKLPAVVCCRCSPQQKADITNLIKSNTRYRVAAIGDGGNDVSMIQAAHIGFGIVGKEGNQASLAADFSLTQFCHLTKLILYHGRNNCKSYLVNILDGSSSPF
jgi:phospholipid-translocating ATPase